MKYVLAPLEGNTTYTFRNAYYKNYGGMERYYTPFIASRKLSSRERNDILPENNAGMETIPQILTGRADEFLDIAADISQYGYRTVNLNLGCPAATVVSRKRGSGFLAYPEELEAFLDEIFTKCPLQISIKTRIGLENIEEWDRLLEIYKKFPLEELIIHPRLRTQGYGGQVHTDCFKMALEAGLPFPVCYNGDILSLNPDVEGYGTISWLSEQFSLEEGKDCASPHSIMLGRGILRNPGMVIYADKTGEPEKREALQTLKHFHSDLLSGYTKIMSGDANTLFKMKDLWTFLSQSFTDSDKYLKKIRKCSRITEYEAAVNALFRECEFAPDAPFQSKTGN